MNIEKLNIALSASRDKFKKKQYQAKYNVLNKDILSALRSYNSSAQSSIMMEQPSFNRVHLGKNSHITLASNWQQQKGALFKKENSSYVQPKKLVNVEK